MFNLSRSTEKLAFAMAVILLLNPVSGQHRRHSGVTLRNGALVGGPLADAL
jgi:hypothetical protein